MKFILDKVEDIVEKGENAVYQHFLLFPQCFQRVLYFSQGRLKLGVCGKGLTHYQTTNSDSAKLKKFADDNFKFDENGRKLSKRVENTVGKGEIARYEQFLLFPQCFQKVCFPGASKGVIMWEWVNRLKSDCVVVNTLTLSQTSPCF